MTHHITIYGRPGCHLCDEAEVRLRELCAGRAEIEVVDIEQDDELHKRLLEQIPVIELDGMRVAQLAEFRRARLVDVIDSALRQ